MVVKSVCPGSDAVEEYFSLVTSSVGLLEDCIMHDIRYDVDSGDRVMLAEILFFFPQIILNTVP